MAQYVKNPPMTKAHLGDDPILVLERWLIDAKRAEMIEPTAMTLATVDADHRPTARVVLMRGIHDGGLRFYTHYDSRKARALLANPWAAATFWWDKLERSVRVEGQVRKLPTEVSTDYFHSRPRGSQIGAWTSHQSQVIATRADLEQRLQENEERFAQGEIPLPEFWGGYVLVPTRIEFWQGRDNRLHDRICFCATPEGWEITRLQP